MPLVTGNGYRCWRPQTSSAPRPLGYLVGADQVEQSVGGDRLVVVMALRVVAAEFEEGGVLGGGLDAFGDGPYAEGVRGR